MKQIISKEDVAKALQDLTALGRRPTLAALHAALQNRGSMSTLVRLKGELEAAAQPVTDSADGLKAFREIWALAVEEGRNQQNAIVAELRDSLNALVAENERLDGTAIAAQNHAAELEQAVSRGEGELNRLRARQTQELEPLRTALLAASARTAEVLQKLSDIQAARSSEVAALQRDLVGAVSKAHELELKLVHAQALLETKGIQTTENLNRQPPITGKCDNFNKECLQ